MIEIVFSKENKTVKNIMLKKEKKKNDTCLINMSKHVSFSLLLHNLTIYNSDIIHK